ncbi:DNRLRE domain-containing protein [Flavitalea sp. BT771]|uniref:DNRLRE domain-containing protein n=1 Tax=Flavitalea sp. BT771 TaxID=3063329 RepID=UPI0026E232F9|nr:DNRLRE domain-containing protein [Flavitalea sp. BT771]MDO6432904.1 DNRLRE domain-containing protein [Flavitalea sp. BT771]MDV6221820.1 DNRLRE domain-containing protein [Flavitalea sp. BT771]
MIRAYISTLFFAALFIFTGCKKEQVDLDKPPVVEAGRSQTITLPDSVVLTGTARAVDSGGRILAYLWSQVSGPDATSIINPGSPSTVVRFGVKGTYLFQLEATDDHGNTGVDTVSVIVNASIAEPATLVLQPANNPNEYAVAIYNGGDISGVSGPDIPISAWTISSLPITVRNLMKFDLSSIPSSATIVSANLYLYSYPAPTLNGNFQDANYGSDNTLLVQRVSSSWSPVDPGKTTWSNQPSTDTTHQAIAPSTTQSQLDLNLDVTGMVRTMVLGHANYGFLLRLQNEVTYTSRIFVASHNTTYTTKYPKLVVTYQ